jgi:restriction system protein
MANKIFSFNKMIRAAQQFEAAQRRVQREGLRLQNEKIRQLKALERERERRRKKDEKAKKEREKQKSLKRAAELTKKAENDRKTLLGLLKKGAKKPISFSWELYKIVDTFKERKPTSPSYRSLPKEIRELDYIPAINFWDKIFRHRIKRKRTYTQEKYQRDFERWKNDVEKINEENNGKRHFYEKKLKDWNRRKEIFEQDKKSNNEKLDLLECKFKSSQKEGVEFYFSNILTNSTIPKELITNWELAYNEESKILVIDYALPDKKVIPSLKTLKYIISRNEFKESLLNERDINKLYDELLYQITLRITNDLYVSDIHAQVDSIVFNGIHTGINKSTGIKETNCILSLQTTKEEFEKIVLENVTAKSCFLKFNGRSASKLYEIVPVPPILKYLKEDSRFIEGKDVSDSINDTNLACMDWQKFEHLIRMVFEKEFSNDDAEVKITQSSRDGGIDAVVWDPDPIKGGKFVIQAKRYTNVVGVSAVRDLYGAIMNEGAEKGILVTTSNYGADSYKFAENKPISLLDGSNLLHLLEKHGFNARIDIEEAKRVLKQR